MNEDVLRQKCSKKVDEICRNADGKDVYIWGTGKGCQTIMEVLKEKNIPIVGIIDQNADTMKAYCDIPVFNKEILPNKNAYILIGMIRLYEPVVKYLLENGFNTNDWCYVYDHLLFNEEDIIYKGCRIGRYTYGYETLMEYYPYATEIGRFCSINPTARIWNNHPIDFVTTHPILDYPFFYPWEKYEERQALIEKYGKYENNVACESSKLRKNEPIVIGNDVWIGANVCILPGVAIGDGAVLAAGAVITKDVEPYAIVGGVPAKVIRYRFTKDQIEKLLTIKWWDWPIKEIEEKIELFYKPEYFLEKVMI